MLAWDEYVGPPTPGFPQPPRPPEAVKVMVGDSVTQPSRPGALTARVYGNDAGKVLYRDDAQVYAWDRASAAKTLRLEGHFLQPPFVFVTGGAAVYNVGPALYRVPL